MSDTHRTDFTDFDLEVTVNDDGDVLIDFRHPDGEHHIRMEWDTLREVIDFVGVHGLAMKEPYFVEYVDTVEGRDERLGKAVRGES